MTTALPRILPAIVALALSAGLTQALPATAAEAADGTGTLSGRVVGSNGQPVTALEAVAERQDEHPNDHDITSADVAADGTFTIPGLEPGDYNVWLFDGEGRPGPSFGYYGGTPTNPWGTVVSVNAGDVLPLGDITAHWNAYLDGHFTCDGCIDEDAYLYAKMEYRESPESAWAEVPMLGPFNLSQPYRNDDGSVRPGYYQKGGLYPGTYRVVITSTDRAGVVQTDASEAITFDGSANRSVTIPDLHLEYPPITARAASLVKTAASPEIYMTDGAGGLIRVRSFDTVIDLGLPTSYSTITPGQFSASKILDQPLRSVYRCGETPHLASRGQDYFLPAAAIDWSELLELPLNVCPRSTPPAIELRAPVTMKSSTSPVVYLISGGSAHAVPDMATLSALAPPDGIVTVSPSAMADVPLGDDVLAVGGLVKSSTAATVYLVDSIDHLIPIRSFRSVTDMGLSASWRTVPDATIERMSKDTEPMSAFVRCNGAVRLAAGGWLHLVPEHAIGTLPVTSLSSGLCSMRAWPWLPLTSGDSLFLGDGVSPVIFRIADGEARPISSMTAAQSLANPAPFWRYTVDPSFLATVPKGPTILGPGTLAKAAESPQIFMVDGYSRLIPIASFDDVRDFGISLAWETADLSGYEAAAAPLSHVTQCPDGRTFFSASNRFPVVASVVSGLPITSVDAETCARLMPSGSPRTKPMVLRDSAGAVFEITPEGTKRYIRSMLVLVEAFQEYQYTLRVSDSFLASLPLGPDRFASGALLKTTDAETVYVANGSDGLIPLHSPAAASDAGLGSTVTVVDPGRITGLTVASGSFGNLTRCGDTVAISAGGLRLPIVPSSVAGLEILDLPATMCQRVPQGAALTQPPLVKSATDPVIFALVDGVKRPISDFAQISAIIGGAAPRWATVNPGFLDSIPTGPPAE